MELHADSKLVRIFVGELDKIGHKPLYEAILFEARQKGMAGCTVLRGIMGYGASSIVHTAKLIEISEDLPIVIEVIDHADKITAFLESVNTLMADANCGGLITLEKAEVLYYKNKKG